MVCNGAVGAPWWCGNECGNAARRGPVNMDTITTDEITTDTVTTDAVAADSATSSAAAAEQAMAALVQRRRRRREALQDRARPGGSARRSDQAVWPDSVANPDRIQVR